MFLTVLLLMTADPPFAPLPRTTAACVTDLAATYVKAKESADIVADAVAQDCFFKQPSSGPRVCYLMDKCDPTNRAVAEAEMRRIKLQALAEVVRIRAGTSP